MIKIKKKRFRPKEIALKRLFELLDQRQRMFLNSFRRESTKTLGDAFRSGSVIPKCRRGCLERWMDEEPFHHALNITLRTQPAERADGIRDAIYQFYLRRPLHEVCEVKKRRPITPTGWQRNHQRMRRRKTREALAALMREQENQSYESE